jgi:hypothetical protein
MMLMFGIILLDVPVVVVPVLVIIPGDICSPSLGMYVLSRCIPVTDNRYFKLVRLISCRTNAAGTVCTYIRSKARLLRIEEVDLLTL